MSELFQCRSCGSGRSELVLDLGLQPLANNFLRPADLGQPEPCFPLRVFVCPDCWLLQITAPAPPPSSALQTLNAPHLNTHPVAMAYSLLRLSVSTA